MSNPGPPPPPATPYGVPPPYAEPPKGKMNGCLVGCLAVLGLMILVFAVGGLVLYTQVKKLRANWTDTAPVPVPVAVIGDPEWTDLQARIDKFRDEMKDGTRTEPLKLKENEINAYMQRDPEFSDFGKHFAVDVEGDKLKGQISVPLEGIPLMSGRYFNGTFYARLGLIDGEIYPALISAEVKGKPVPDELLKGLNDKVTEEVHKAENNPKAAGSPAARVTNDWKQKLKSVDIADDSVTLTPEPPTATPSGDAAAPTQETKTAATPEPTKAAEPAKKGEPSKSAEPAPSDGAKPEAAAGGEKPAPEKPAASTTPKPKKKSRK